MGLTDLIIVNVFECVADHTDAHVDKVGRSHLEHLLGKLLSVFVDLLKNKHKTHHAQLSQYTMLRTESADFEQIYPVLLLFVMLQRAVHLQGGHFLCEHVYLPPQSGEQ